MKLGKIARTLGCELRGSKDVEINGVAGIDEADKEDLTFVSNPKYLPKIESSQPVDLQGAFWQIRACHRFCLLSAVSRQGFFFLFFFFPLSSATSFLSRVTVRTSSGSLRSKT